MIVAAVQLRSTEDVGANLERAEYFIARAAQAGARIVALPENFAYLRSEGESVSFSDQVGGNIHSRLSQLSLRLGVYILAGSIPEKAVSGKVYNTSALIDPAGEITAVYRKIHLFDATLKDGTVLEESKTVQRGDSLVLGEVDGVRVGLSICYDLRFPELYREMTRRGAEAIFVPSAFTVPTGRDHWEVLLRARAIENQVYVIAPAQYGQHNPRRASYGRSMIIDPWGTILAQAPDKEALITAEMDLERLKEIRALMPCLKHRRLN